MTDFRPQKELCKSHGVNQKYLADSGLPWIRRGNQVFLDREALERLLEKKCRELFVGDGKRDG